MTRLARLVRGHVYRTLATRGVAPLSHELVAGLGAAPAAVRQALDALADAHALILDARGEVEWALPFSSVATPYRVTDGRVTWHAPCAWDALSLAPLLDRAVRVQTRCADCGDALEVRVTPHAATLATAAGRGAPVVHFARAARDWWADIRET